MPSVKSLKCVSLKLIIHNHETEMTNIRRLIKFSSRNLNVYPILTTLVHWCSFIFNEFGIIWNKKLVNSIVHKKFMILSKISQNVHKSIFVHKIFKIKSKVHKSMNFVHNLATLTTRLGLCGNTSCTTPQTVILCEPKFDHEFDLSTLMLRLFLNILNRQRITVKSTYKRHLFCYGQFSELKYNFIRVHWVNSTTPRRLSLRKISREMNWYMRSENNLGIARKISLRQ